MSKKIKDSFVLYTKKYECVRNCTTEQKAQLFDAFFKYHLEEEINITDPMAQMAFSFFKSDFEINAKKYEDICQKRREAINKRYQKQDGTSEYKSIQKNSKENKSIQKDYDNDHENDHVNENDNVNENVNDNVSSRKEKKASVRTRGAAAAYSEEFEAFWTVYPRKEGKGKAWESWQKLKALIPDDVCERVQRAARCEQWQKDGGQFIPHPTTWLNQRRWDDEMCQKPKSTLAPWQIRENEMEAMIQQLVFKKFPDIDYFYMTDEQTDYCMELRDLSYEELLELCSAA